MEENELTTELVEERVEESVDAREEMSKQVAPYPYAVQPVAHNYYGHYGYYDERGGFWPILPFLFLIPFLFNNKQSQSQYVLYQQPYQQPYPQPYQQPYPALYPYPGSGYQGR
ncbi:hypothetical protein DFP93_10175 [Aneurinibacillus soli]|uniref:Uncharacterized protein n=1 Tax=Aneurinibacillus soli TaxID=1500254 RepID=A0A0U5B160_9BACL|nr:hypothetical protein [Aneurinibacillus soli]PYE64051.1 hypothetical protein DFP93_10175 [Aneurinibacillus soli]BAU28000.1 hypothetical protein CB4_02174 [Aneurinibacillus soli]